MRKGPLAVLYTHLLWCLSTTSYCLSAIIDIYLWLFTVSGHFHLIRIDLLMLF